MYVDNNAGGVGPSKLVHTEQGTKGFSFCLITVWSGFAQIFSHCISMTIPLGIVMCNLHPYILEV